MSISAKERREIPDNKMGDPAHDKFPLDTKEHIRSAANLIGHAKDKKQVAENILRRAKEEGVSTDGMHKVKQVAGVAEQVPPMSDGTSLGNSPPRTMAPYYDEAGEQLAQRLAATSSQMSAGVSPTTEEDELMSRMNQIGVAHAEAIGKRDMKAEPFQFAQKIVKEISAQVEKDSKPPTGNQNCQLCTWCAEARYRGINALPRPIYSPRDPALAIKGETIVMNPIKESFRSQKEVVRKVRGNVDSRWYVHVNWKDSTGGHEFLVININDYAYIMDAQAGLLKEIDESDSTHNYFRDINFKNSFMVRLDTRPFNTTLFNDVNNPANVLLWDPKKDVPYMRDNGMLGDVSSQYTMRAATESDLEFVYQSELATVGENKNDPKVQKYIREDAKESLGHTKIIVMDDGDIGVYQAYETNYYGLREGKRDWWYLAHIYIKPEYRNLGIGSDIIKNDIKNHNKILLQVMKSNTRAKKLYESLGFVVDMENDHGGLVMRLDKSKSKDVQESFVTEQKSQRQKYHLVYDKMADDFIELPVRTFNDIFLACMKSDFDKIPKTPMTVKTSDDAGGSVFPDFIYDSAVPLFSKKLFNAMSKVGTGHMLQIPVTIEDDIDGTSGEYILGLPPRVKPTESGKYPIFKSSDLKDDRIYINDKMRDVLEKFKPVGMRWYPNKNIIQEGFSGKNSYSDEINQLIGRIERYEKILRNETNAENKDKIRIHLVGLYMNLIKTVDYAAHDTHIDDTELNELCDIINDTTKKYVQMIPDIKKPTYGMIAYQYAIVAQVDWAELRKFINKPGKYSDFLTEWLYLRAIGSSKEPTNDKLPPFKGCKEIARFIKGEITYEAASRKCDEYVTEAILSIVNDILNKKSKPVQESSDPTKLSNKLIPVKDYPFDTVYKGAMGELKMNPLFVTPYKGIASIFAAHDAFVEKLHKMGLRSFNSAYDEWNYPPEKLQDILKVVHVKIYSYEGKTFEPFEIDAEGFVYTFDVSNLKDKIYRYNWMDPDKEALVANYGQIEMPGAEKVTIHYIVEPVKHIQEGAFQDIKNGVNPYSDDLVFHVSMDKHIDGQVWKPRVPDYLDPYNPEDTGFEDNTTPRICFSTSIEGALNGITVNLQRQSADTFDKMYVYVPEKPWKEYKHKTNKQLVKGKLVYDANVTREVWIMEPVRMKLYGVIRVDQIADAKRKSVVPTSKGQKDTRNYFTYKWHWVVKPKVLKKATKFDYSPERVIDDLCVDVKKFKYGLIKDGRLMTGNVSDADYDKYWVFHSGETVDQAGGGNCYDMVEYEAGYLEAFGVTYKKYFMNFTDTKNTETLGTHTICVVPHNGKFIYIEQAFKRVVDEWGYERKKVFDKLTDIFEYVAEVSAEYHNQDVNYGVWDYTNAEIDYGTPIKNFQEWIMTKCKMVHDGEASKSKPVKESFVIPTRFSEYHY